MYYTSHTLPSQSTENYGENQASQVSLQSIRASFNNGFRLLHHKNEQHAQMMVVVVATGASSFPVQVKLGTDWSKCKIGMAIFICNGCPGVLCHTANVSMFDNLIS